MALKISRNKKFDTDNAHVEFKLLQTLNTRDPHDQKGVVRVLDSFSFRKHVVLVFELLGVNLYKHLHKNLEKTGLEKKQIKDIAFQMSNTMSFIKEVGIIHCDLKPENILFSDEKMTNVKLIDFGSSCANYKQGFTYVQSRYYRCPEIALGLPYSHPADMWSFGCILAELRTGMPLFPAVDENELIEFFVMVIGMPPSEMIEKAKKKSKYFKDNQIIRSKISRLKDSYEGSYPLRQILHCEPDDDDFLDFIEVIF